MNFADEIRAFPTTRYQGSKRKLLPWIYNIVKDIDFHTVLDVFGGSGSVSLLFKKMNKATTFNDVLKFNSVIGDSIIANSFYSLSHKDVTLLLDFSNISSSSQRFITNTFSGIYYLEEENLWIDNIIMRIKDLQLLYSGDELKYKQSIAYNALFQSCMAKRPYNLFHRKNLEMRTRCVERSFGNKKTWDTPFECHYKKFVWEINNVVFDSKVQCASLNKDVFDLNTNYDLVYLDPPYIKKSNESGSIDYIKYYHFLEGLVNYDNWGEKIDESSLNKHMQYNLYPNRFTCKNAVRVFEQIINKFQNSILVLSYKDGGIPSIDELINILYSFKRNISIHKIPYKYALNRQKANLNYEYLLIGY